MISTLLKKSLKKNKFLIMAHRGVFGGNIVENTDISVKASFLSGADIAELDVILSKDKKFYLFHNGNEEKLFGKDFDIRELESSEIEELRYLNSLNKRCDKHPSLLEKVLRELGDDQLINIDRSWFYWKELLPYLDEFKVEENIILKSKPEKEYLEILNKHQVKYMYFAIVKDLEEIEVLKNYPDINLCGLELIAEDNKSDFLDKNTIKKLKEKNLLTIVNSEKLDDSTRLFSNLDDENAILNNFEPWDILTDLGVDIIQTDFCRILNNYRNCI